MDSLSRIGSTLGVPIYADECTTKQLRVSFARILIEMDVTGKVKEEINVEDPNGRVFKQRVSYTWLPPFCNKCQKVGHVCEEKKKQAKGKVTQKWIPVNQAKDLPATTPALEVDIGDERVTEIVSNPSNPSNVTPVVTPISSTQRQEIDEEGAWKLVTRKTKDKGKQVSFQAARTTGMGMNDPFKIKEIKNVLLTHKIAVCVLLETRVREQNASKEQFIVCTLKDQVHQINLVAVYGLHTIADRRVLWSGLSHCIQHQEPMIIIGDFNVVCNTNDRLNGTLITNAETEDFQNFLLQSSLIESRSTGSFYSWSNSSVGSDRVVSRIDKAFANQAWLSMYTEVVVEYLAPGISDHSPLKFALVAGNVQGGRLFKFLNIMAEQEDFLLTVDKAWSSVQESGDYDSNAEAQLTVKGLLNDLNHWSHVEESILHQKSRINWLQKGDANTKLFFTATKARHGQNRIELIIADDGRIVKDAGAIREEILDFYKKLLGTRATSLQGVD
ncbi:uncharacterized protein LOC130590789 [Beta vulgaris subsp. vulgaris]|uniref:uncharacterized protein LOC130590789 n=1 Tax=Beta vulgaris subsp. vulgaris TaxID=3555 RepID=UPI002549BFE4|nr:uncharacterized protein LOC130590789 [Beta vulgaris subsp. vulgaris]